MTARAAAGALLAGAVLAPPGWSATWRVTPDLDPVDVQEVMDAAVYGDTVLVAPGQYRMLRVRNGIRLIAERGPAETIFRFGRNYVIDASETDSTTLVEGFTVDGVKAAEGVLIVENSQARVRDCVVKNGWSGVRGIYSDFVLENCTITDCQNGIYLFESRGVIAGNEIRRCISGITLVSASPIIQRNVVERNSVGISVSEHSDPSIGGSLATANRIFNNPGAAIKNTALQKRAGLRTLKPLTLRVPFNYWGTDCPDSLLFRGPVRFQPWVDETGTRSLETCESPAPE